MKSQASCRELLIVALRCAPRLGSISNAGSLAGLSADADDTPHQGVQGRPRREASEESRE
eukprot:CAMPEP_0206522528 /NCGR_PEP_ID=MMETSP0324_2-20121206/67037_1 /ASSEMBLY_ACC=CAM_ASM_000836 /TAXON_ID=2866 /ORGANISM="Crypthecodinium cohnii, Strain Seligo" /LENGTH=59 /DNA_ID=CAMNT_0054016711 /DNA_START=367 /DNA_END=543 /DNA_ORIENTATION=-